MDETTYIDLLVVIIYHWFVLISIRWFILATQAWRSNVGRTGEKLTYKHRNVKGLRRNVTFLGSFLINLDILSYDSITPANNNEKQSNWPICQYIYIYIYIYILQKTDVKFYFHISNQKRQGLFQLIRLMCCYHMDDSMALLCFGNPVGTTLLVPPRLCHLNASDGWLTVYFIHRCAVFN